MSTIISQQETQRRILWLIWGTMLGSLIVYLGLGEVLRGLPVPNTAPMWTEEALLNLFYGTAVGLFALITALKSWSTRLEQESPASDGDDLSTPSSARTFVASMLIFALAESIGLLGLVLYWLIRERNPFYLLLATALTTLLLHRPGRGPGHARGGKAP